MLFEVELLKYMRSKQRLDTLERIKQMQRYTAIVIGFTWMYHLSFLGGMQNNMLDLLKYSNHM